MSRHSAAWAMVAVLGAVLASAPRAAGVEQLSGPTAVRIFLPFAPDGQLRAGLAVANRLPGECFAASRPRGARTRGGA